VFFIMVTFGHLSPQWSCAGGGYVFFIILNNIYSIIVVVQTSAINQILKISRPPNKLNAVMLKD